MFTSGIRWHGQQMVQNTQQFMSMERFIKVTGGLAAALGIDLTQLPGQLLKINPADLQGSYSIGIPSIMTAQDKQNVASALQEMIMLAAKVPQMVPLLGLNLPMIVTQALMMRGVNNTLDLMRAPSGDQQALIMAALASKMMAPERGPNGAGPVQARVLPDDQINREVDSGRLVPMEQPRGVPQ